MASRVKIMSLNVRGLRNQVKRRSIFSYLKNQKATLYCLQETFSNENDEKIWSAEWGGQMRDTANQSYIISCPTFVPKCASSTVASPDIEVIT